MANEKLTQRTEYTGALDGEELQHVVKAGVSWKVKLSTIFTNLSTFLNLTDVKDTTYDGKWGYVPMVGNDNSLTPEPNALILTKLPTFQNLSKGNVLLAGGVNYISGLTYNLWATNYIINSQEYSVQLSANFTLSTADPTNSRIDVYYVGLNGAGVPTLGVLTGTPAASPIEPTLNLTTQVKITTQTILANQTSDPDAVFEMAFDENAGEPTEWDNLFLLPGGNLSYATDPYSGTTSLLVPATTDNYVSWLKDAEYVFNSSEKLVFALKDMVDVLPGSKVQIKLINQTSGLYWILTLSSTNLTTYGYVFGASGWHVISIPLSAFSYNGYVETVDPDYDIIEVTFLGTSVGQLDWIHFQTGVSQPLPTVFVKEIIAGTNVTVDASDPQRPIVSATGIGAMVTQKISLSATQIKNLGTTPIEAIPTPGAGNIIQLFGLMLQLNWNSVAFDNNTLIVETTGALDAWNVESSFLNLTASINRTIAVDHGTLTLVNSPVVITGTDSVATGDSTVDVYITYKIIAL